MATPFEKFTSVLKDLFMLDQADLDFGIYRIINQKRSEIERFLEKDLKLQVQALLKEFDNSDTEAVQKELKQLTATLLSAGMNPDDSPKVQELKKKLATATNASEMEADVYSHLATFFNRYYDSGDFMSNRRYKKDVYAIPYEGEEVKLHWANADQYYIKTTENFQNYTFKIADGRTVHFRLRDASTELNNNKAQSDQVHRFAIAEEEVFEVNGDELYIFFTYELYSKKVRQKDLSAEAASVIINKLQSEADLQPFQLGLLSLAPTEKNITRTLLEKHLNDYVSKNSFDYFIHKDLSGFLRRELDFYIKNEVLFIDDISSRSPEEFVAYLTQVKTIKAVGDKLITFLAQLEDFQKKLWLKKKFVVETNYCITLDRVPEILYSEIINNESQRKEWVSLFAIDEINGSKGNDIFSNGTIGYSEPLTIGFLKQNPYLVLDTAFFDERFKNRLISSIDNFEDQLDGTLINSDNFQALSLLQGKYLGTITSVYADPPYNAKSSEILYKNEFKHSSWLSLMLDRIKLAYNLRTKKGSLITAIDENEFAALYTMCNLLFPYDLKTAISLVHNPAGVQGDNFSYTHEYAIFIFNNLKSIIGKTKRAEISEEAFRDWGGTCSRSLAKNCFYPIHIKNDEIIGFGDVCEDDFHPGSSNILNSNFIEVYPVDDETGEERKWVFARDTVEDIKDNLFVNNKDGIFSIKRIKIDTSYKTVWSDKKYYANIYGSKLLNNIFGYKVFDFPKSIYTVQDCLYAVNEFRNKYSIALDYFAGSGTTGHAVININREDEGNRKYILVEMGTYFDTVTKPRIQKVIYSEDWKDGKPVSRKGSSHCFKYIRLEQYEDTLNNLIIKKPDTLFDSNGNFDEGYLLGYMMDIETRGSLFNIKWFVNPFDVVMKITKQNELKETKIDLVETFNYLIGLNVYNTSYPKDGLCVVEGTTRNGEKSLVIWRDCTKIDSEAINEFFIRSAYSTLDHEYDRIYINGDNMLQNIRKDEDHWKVVLIEEEFSKRMFEA